ncbi:MAG TPA: nicotinate-nicotinamide nucleotide adenylyltransferase [Syntrophobacteria bacterium]|nr:nicotinate-nicotinamide nucleotide adenylyltransferase [Syntrophobacteria bacterium]
MAENVPQHDSDRPHLTLVTRASRGLAPAGGRLGVIGGAYNPITHAHLVLARAAFDQARLDEVLFVLSTILPHKPIEGAAIDQRLEMMRLAVAEVPFATVGLCTHGLFLDIAAAIREVYQGELDVFFIVGRDAAERILTWPYPDPAAALQEMFTAFQLLVFRRRGEFTLPTLHLLQRYADRIHTLPLRKDLDQISSTAAREQAAAGRPLQGLVPERVADYIRGHGLYRA